MKPPIEPSNPPPASPGAPVSAAIVLKRSKADSRSIILSYFPMSLLVDKIASRS